LALPANVAVAWHALPALVQSVGYATVAVPAAPGLTDAFAVKACPVYTADAVPNVTLVVVGALVMMSVALALLDAYPPVPADVAVATQVLPALMQSPV
jgi:hypothetical protein